jgi:hypothetical protein
MVVGIDLADNGKYSGIFGIAKRSHCSVKVTTLGSSITTRSSEEVSGYSLSVRGLSVAANNLGI